MTGDKTWDPDLYQGRHSFVWKAAQDLIGLLAPHAGERILDLGCGTGQLTHEIAAAGADVRGIDKSATMIEQARRNYPTLRFDVADAAELRLPVRFQAVFSNAALHWMTRATEVAARVHEALEPGGRFVGELGGKGNVHRIHAALARAVRKTGHAVTSESSLLYFPSLGEYARVLEAAGFRVTYAVHFDRPTRLDGGETGLRTWISMFADWLLSAAPEGARDGVLQEVETELRPTLHHGGAWHADYVRLRFVAVKSA